MTDIISKAGKSALAIVFAGTLLSAPAQASDAQKFETPEAAVEALLEKLKAKDRDGIVAIFGNGSEDILFTGEDVVDRQTWTDFYRAASAARRVARDVDGEATLYIGEDQWPMPIPLVESDGGWSFDSEAGREEILIRRIGRNEIEVMGLAREYAKAQKEYRQTDHDNDGVLEFAQFFISGDGARDGLYWPSDGGADASPFGPLVALAAAEGYVVDGRPAEPSPFNGYFYRILPGQGENAPGGAYDYVIGGNMVAGHAMLAFPADYGNTGVMSFLVSENGIVLEADLGEDTAELTAQIDTFDPDERWTPADIE